MELDKMKYTQDELSLCIGQMARSYGSSEPFTFLKITRIGTDKIFREYSNGEEYYVSLDGITEVPYLDQIKTKKLFKLILAK